MYASERDPSRKFTYRLVFGTTANMISSRTRTKPIALILLLLLSALIWSPLRVHYDEEGVTFGLKHKSRLVQEPIVDVGDEREEADQAEQIHNKTQTANISEPLAAVIEPSEAEQRLEDVKNATLGVCDRYAGLQDSKYTY